MSQRSVPAPFLMKTYQLVDDESSDDVVSWNEDGTTFVVWKTAEFAKDLLPNYFKHNNFSSFVRQLNTYGFRKTVPDKWEFANENFRRGEKQLLTKIYRRKTVTPTTVVGKSIVGCTSTSPSNSGEDLGSSSTSSPDAKNPGSVETATTTTIIHFANLNDENEKLRKENQMLSSELSNAKKQCEELINFLTQHMKIPPEQINNIVSQGVIDISNHVGVEDGGGEAEDGINDSDNDNDDDENGESLKLFGVMLKEKKRKRGHNEIIEISKASKKDLKSDDFSAPWMKISSSVGESSKVCN